MKREKKRAFDVIFCSRDIRKIIISRIKELKISPYLMCKNLKVNHAAFEAYLRTFNPLNMQKGNIVNEIKQEDILSVAKALGIDVSIRLTLKDVKNVDVTKFQLETINKKIKYKKTAFDKMVKEFFE